MLIPINQNLWLQKGKKKGTLRCGNLVLKCLFFYMEENIYLIQKFEQEITKSS